MKGKLEPSERERLVDEGKTRDSFSLFGLCSLLKIKKSFFSLQVKVLRRVL